MILLGRYSLKYEHPLVMEKRAVFATWCNYRGEEHTDKEVYYAKSKVWCDVKQSALVGRRKPCTASPCVCQSAGCWAPGWHLACRMFSLAVGKAQRLLVSVPENV